MNRRVSIFTIPRSGSWPVSQTVAHYFNKTEGSKFLGEYFNLNWRGWKVIDGKIEVDLSAVEPPPFASTLPKTQQLEELEARFNALRVTKEPVILKVFPREITPKIGKWLTDNTQLIFLRRRNRLEHLLSFLISRATGLFYQRGGIQVERASLTASKNWFFEFHRLIFSFEYILAKTPKPKIVYYEDLFSQSPAHFMAALGYNESIDWTGLSRTDKQNASNKLELFNNAQEILSWFNDSGLEADPPATPI